MGEVEDETGPFIFESQYQGMLVRWPEDPRVFSLTSPIADVTHDGAVAITWPNDVCIYKLPPYDERGQLRTEPPLVGRLPLGNIAPFSISGDRILVFLRDRLAIYGLGGQPVRELPPVACAAFDDRARFLASVEDGGVTIRDGQTFDLVRRVDGVGGDAIAVAPDLSAIAVRRESRVHLIGVTASRAAGEAWPPVFKRGLGAGKRIRLRDDCERALGELERHDVSAIARLEDLRDESAELRHDAAIARRIHRAIAPYARPLAVRALKLASLPAAAPIAAFAGVALWVASERGAELRGLDGTLRAEHAVGPVDAIAVGGDYACLLGRDRRATIVEGANVIAAVGEVVAIAWQPSAPRLAMLADLRAVSPRMSLAVWDAPWREEPWWTDLDEHRARRLAWSERGELLVATGPTTVMLGPTLAPLRHVDVPSLGVSDDGRWLVTPHAAKLNTVSMLAARTTELAPRAGLAVSDDDLLFATFANGRIDIAMADPTWELLETVLPDAEALAAFRPQTRWQWVYDPDTIGPSRHQLGGRSA